MKPAIKHFALCALLGVPGSVHADPVFFPNGEFEIADGANWEEAGGGITYEYPTTGGNPGGYGVMDAQNGQWSIWISNDGVPVPLDSLGLIAGESYTFTQDMFILAGSSIGGVKIESWTDTAVISDSGDVYPELIGTGGTWETYSFEYTIEPAATGIKLVPLWGPSSSVGFDNFCVVQPVPTIFAASLATGTVLSWTAEGADSFYQPQSSTDNVTWTNLGPNLFGDTVTSTFDPDDAPFHRVEETFLDVIDDILNGDFEEAQEGDPTCPQSWNCTTNDSQPPTLITTDSRSGDASMQIVVVNDDGGTPNSAEIQQNITLEGGEILPGATYDFSFWAKQISSGVSYVQKFQLQWLNDEGAPLGGGIAFTDFAGGSGDWAEVTASGLVAPDETATAFIQIFGSTGAVPGATAEGGVLIDDVSLSTSEVAPIETLTPTTGPGVQISWPTEAGLTYQAKSSTNLIDFTNLGTPITGDGDIKSVTDLLTIPAKYYLVEESN